MITNVSSKSNRINVKNLVFCTLTSDDSSGVVYGDVYPLAKAMTIEVTPTQATGVLYGDGAQQENLAKLTGLAASLEVNKIAIENGVMLYSTDDEAPYIAIGYEVEGTNGFSEYVWLLKGRVQEGNQNAAQATDKINFTTDKMLINFIPREYDKYLEFTADSANSEFKADQIENWFKTGPVTYPKHSA